ncbi:hypothetical protein WA158_005001 [Blastocystis sp. Blastoise]
MSSTTVDLTEEQINEYRQTFDLLDRDQKGAINRQEFKALMRSLGQYPTDDEIEEMISQFDTNSDGLINFDEFLQMMAKQIQASENFDQIEEAFKSIDVDKDGYITKTELRQIMSKLGENLTDEELDTMIREADKNNDGKVDISEFRDLVKTD